MQTHNNHIEIPQDQQQVHFDNFFNWFKRCGGMIADGLQLEYYSGSNRAIVAAETLSSAEVLVFIPESILMTQEKVE